MRSRDDRVRTRPALVAGIVVLGLIPPGGGRARAGQAEPDRTAPCALLTSGTRAVQQLAYLGELKRAGRLEPALVARIIGQLSASNGAADHRLIAAVLDVLRAHREYAQSSASALTPLLRHRAELYQGRDKEQVLRLRAYLFVVLSELGYPESALPMLVDTLAHVDERSSALELAAGARVVGTLGARGRAFVPYLLGTFGERFAEEEFSLERYELVYPESESTTLQLEATRALGRVVTVRETAAVALLERLARDAGQGSIDPRLRSEARRSLDNIMARTRRELSR